jgi:hypothetical protein
MPTRRHPSPAALTASEAKHGRRSPHEPAASGGGGGGSVGGGVGGVGGVVGAPAPAPAAAGAAPAAAVVSGRSTAPTWKPAPTFNRSSITSTSTTTTTSSPSYSSSWWKPWFASAATVLLFLAYLVATRTPSTDQLAEPVRRRPPTGEKAEEEVGLAGWQTDTEPVRLLPPSRRARVPALTCAKPLPTLPSGRWARRACPGSATAYAV